MNGNNPDKRRRDKLAALFRRGFGKHTDPGLFLSREILSITGITITENGVPGMGTCFELKVPGGIFLTVPDGDNKL
ncbi:hypothetical protein [Methanoplanus endosymbiosus]|uniref:Uncharacterized protein n=1 Tax=Methanoplanus endosymbiosus TaxID=33865 RepID=A0A9E7PQ14_9EURY|nr:hypothetical protein [Methanoplanus endosymbiosus]UUX92906.1 hypothetical protein L6E24_01905 [Methanoplanus endosymbiosus]